MNSRCYNHTLIQPTQKNRANCGVCWLDSENNDKIGKKEGVNGKKTEESN